MCYITVVRPGLNRGGKDDETLLGLTKNMAKWMKGKKSLFRHRVGKNEPLVREERRESEGAMGRLPLVVKWAACCFSWAQCMNKV